MSKTGDVRIERCEKLWYFVCGYFSKIGAGIYITCTSLSACKG